MNTPDEIKQILRTYGHRISFAYLFGSSARGEATAASDLDIAIHCRSSDPEECFIAKLDLQADLCRSLGRNDIDILVLNTAPILLLDEVVRQGILLHEQEPAAREKFELDTLHQAIDFKSQRLAIIGA
ncbi:type VII toxin-antitoxin system MntA family adenylyltransferase antitoxin [Desulfurivibrio dismutans]|uniref:type VII toxin-antitoxin system MntA family adenylyltransferase antitoxin n=1 Tax=Desulfurivibrio dismutans TaxID=1398908 RepID=UPI0023DA731E|nr:nucleotidyltransferase domain-containing protein [Desulfurivibrio alkaliphilus]MDF1613498.1 nucleotidyltransferase domain-containing protein [Desulfurivibrio alkaliphilus]